MKNSIVIIGFIIFAILLYFVWAGLDSKIVAIESTTGSYTEQFDDQPVVEASLDIDLDALLSQLALLESAQMTNAEAIAELLRRLQALEDRECRGVDCLNKITRREVVYFDHGQSQLSQNEMTRIDKILSDLNDRSFVSLRGHADTSGTNQFNHLLSLQRAASVKRYIDERLRLDGRLNNLLISIDGTGEESVVKATEDDVEEPSNRIVEILIFE